MNEETFGVIASKSWTYNKQRTIRKKSHSFCTIYCKRKYQETGGKLRHTLGYYAQMIANQTGNKLNWRELKAEYLDPVWQCNV